MSVKPILWEGDPVLRQVSTVAPLDAELAKLAQDLIDTLVANPGLGLAAPQIGVAQRVMYVKVPQGAYSGKIAPNGKFPDVLEQDERHEAIYVNPKLADFSEETCTYDEGCLSLPNVFAPLARPKTLLVSGHVFPVSLTGALGPLTPITLMPVKGMAARVLQHEFDHLEGKLFIDRLDAMARANILVDWKNARKKLLKKAKAK